MRKKVKQKNFQLNSNFSLMKQIEMLGPNYFEAI